MHTLRKKLQIYMFYHFFYYYYDIFFVIFTKCFNKRGYELNKWVMLCSLVNPINNSAAQFGLD
jgi:hypothetical protein